MNLAIYRYSVSIYYYSINLSLYSFFGSYCVNNHGPTRKSSINQEKSPLCYQEVHAQYQEPLSRIGSS